MIDINTQNIATIRSMLAAASSELRFGPAAELAPEFAARQAEMLCASESEEVWLVCTTVNGEELCAAITGNGSRSRANAELFAHSPVIIDGLLGKIDALTAELAEARAAAERWKLACERQEQANASADREDDKRVEAARVEGAQVEREACALIADGEAHTFAAQRIAAAIRARGAGGAG